MKRRALKKRYGHAASRPKRVSVGVYERRVGEGDEWALVGVVHDLRSGKRLFETELYPMGKRATVHGIATGFANAHGWKIEPWRALRGKRAS